MIGSIHGIVDLLTSFFFTGLILILYHNFQV